MNKDELYLNEKACEILLNIPEMVSIINSLY